MKFAYAMVVVLGVSGAAGCKKIAAMITGKAANAAAQAAGSDPGAEAVGSYNKGFNLLLEDPRKVVEEYHSKIPEAGPEAGKKYSLFPRHTFAETKLGEIKTAFAEGEKAAPDSLKHLSPLAKACVTDLEKVVTVFKSAHQYYDAEDYKDDQGAKGKALHADFVQASDSFEKDLAKFEAALSVIEDQQMAEELKSYEGDKSYSYWFRVYNQHANKLIKAKKEGFAAAFAEIEKSHAGLTAWSSGKPDLNAAFKAYATQADRYLAAAKKLKRALDDGATGADEIDRQRDALIDAYNAMIGVSNSLRELEANDALK